MSVRLSLKSTIIIFTDTVIAVLVTFYENTRTPTEYVSTSKRRKLGVLLGMVMYIHTVMQTRTCLVRICYARVSYGTHVGLRAFVLNSVSSTQPPDALQKILDTGALAARAGNHCRVNMYAYMFCVLSPLSCSSVFIHHL